MRHRLALTTLFLAAVLLFGLSALADTEKYPASPEDLLSRTHLREYDLSPDGNWLLYVAGGVPYDAETGWEERSSYHVYRVPAVGGDPRQMTTSEAGERNPTWSPDGKSFAFLSKRNDSMQIYVMPVDGGEGKQVGKLDVAPHTLKWAPDGKSLSFLAAREVEDTPEPKVFEEAGEMSRLWVLSYPSGEVKEVTDGTYNVVDYDWSSDGKSITLATTPTELNYDLWNKVSMRVVDLEGKTLTTLTPEECPGSSPRFSPDGSRVAWIFADGGLSLPNGLGLCNADGSDYKNIAADLDLCFMQIRWSADSKSLFALTGEGTLSRIRKVDVSTGETTITYAPEGAMRSFDMDPGETAVVFNYSDPGNSADAWILRKNKLDPERLTELNPKVEEWLLPTVERFTFAAKDGTEIEGMLWQTPVPPEKGTAPLMVMPHGGPDWMDQYRFDSWCTYFTGQGFNVLQVNFRGSFGYGFDFYAANRGKLGYVDFGDIMAGVDHLIELKKADPERLVIGGWSYGGYMTAWAVTQTDRFKAGFVGAGIGNYVSNYAQSDINHLTAGDWEFLGNPYENFENFRRSSPVAFIQNVTTPVYIVHGESDERISYTQGLEIYRGLKDLGKEVHLVLYPGEPHSFRKPGNWTDCLNRWSAWYDKHLGIER